MATSSRRAGVSAAPHGPQAVGRADQTMRRRRRRCRAPAGAPTPRRTAATGRSAISVSKRASHSGKRSGTPSAPGHSVLAQRLFGGRRRRIQTLLVGGHPGRDGVGPAEPFEHLRRHGPVVGQPETVRTRVPWPRRRAGRRRAGRSPSTQYVGPSASDRRYDSLSAGTSRRRLRSRHLAPSATAPDGSASPSPRGGTNGE